VNKIIDHHIAGDYMRFVLLSIEIKILKLT